MSQDVNIGEPPINADRFKIAGIDLSSVQSVNALLLLLQQAGTGGSISGVTNVESTGYSSSTQRKERANAQSLSMLEQLSAQQTEQVWNLFWNEPAEIAAEILDEMDTIQEEANDALSKVAEHVANGTMSLEQAEEATDQITTIMGISAGIQRATAEQENILAAARQKMETLLQNFGHAKTGMEQKILGVMATSRNLVTAHIDIPGNPAKIHIVFKDGDRFYVENENERFYLDPQEHAQVLSDIDHQQKNPGAVFGNDLERSDIDNFNSQLDELREFCRQYRMLQHHDELVETFYKASIAESRLMTLEREAAIARTEMDRINAELDTNSPENAARLQELNEQLQQNRIEYNELIERYADDVERARSVSYEALSSIAEVKRGILGYRDRHEQLEKAYGGDFLSFAGKYSNGIIAWAAGKTVLSWAGTDIAKAWENPITDDEGNVVYRINEDRVIDGISYKAGTLYTYDDGVRNVIEDPLKLLEYCSRAYGDPPELFGNETPNGEDSENGYNQTRKAILSAQDTARQLEEQLNRQQQVLQAAVDPATSDATPGAGLVMNSMLLSFNDTAPPAPKDGEDAVAPTGTSRAALRERITSDFGQRATGTAEDETRDKNLTQLANLDPSSTGGNGNA